MRQRPGRPNAARDGAAHRKAELFEPDNELVEHRPFAPEQMADPGDVEHEVAIAGSRQHADQRAGIGVPVGKIGKHRLDERPVDLAHHQLGAERPRIGQALRHEQPGGEGARVEFDQPHRPFLPLVKSERGGEFGQRRLSPPETVGGPARQVKRHVAPVGRPRPARRRTPFL